MNCTICNNTFSTSPHIGTRRKICYDAKCIKQAEVIRRNKRERKLDLKKHNEIKNNLHNLTYGVDYVICEWNNMYLKVIKTPFIQRYFPNKTFADYKKEFPNARTKCKNATGFVSGDKHHMKQDKYRKMFSKKMSGDNNPSKRRSKQSLRESSPFSKEFYKKREGINDDEAELKVSKFVKTALKDRVSAVSLQYWTDKYGIKEGERLYKIRQTTNGLNFYIKKYGVDDGTIKYNERIASWKEKMFVDGKVPNGRSKMADSFCESILDFLDVDSNTEIFYGDNEYKINHKDKYYLYDFTLINYESNVRKIIEINGDYWHCNPINEQWNDVTKKHPTINKTVGEIREYDEYKKHIAGYNKFDIFIVWEYDIKNNFDVILDEVLLFLNP